MTEHPGEQFPPNVDPDVEPYPSEETPDQPDYDAEPGRIDPAEVEFGPEFARPRGEEHEHAFVAESAEDPQAEEEGHPLVEETMDRLDGLRDRPVSEHAEVYADLHERLQSALVEADAEHGDRT
ncbi:hypothetical protein [Kribbella sp. NPDC055071]